MYLLHGKKALPSVLLSDLKIEMKQKKKDFNQLFGKTELLPRFFLIAKKTIRSNMTKNCRLCTDLCQCKTQTHVNLLH